MALKIKSLILLYGIPSKQSITYDEAAGHQVFSQNLI